MVRPCNLKDVELPGLRGKIAAFIESSTFIQGIMILILINAVTLGLETSKNISPELHDFLLMFDRGLIFIFTIEIALKIFCYRLSFFRQGWNVFDFIIVAICLIPTSGSFAILRALRILRILRLISVVPSMRRVITGLLNAIPGMSSVVGLLMLVFYVSSVLCTKIFGTHPDEHMEELFGTVPASMYSLFQVMTLEGWSETIVRPTMDIFPWSWMFFIPFIIITAFGVLNFFIGIIVDSMQQADRITSYDDIESARAESHKDSLILHDEIKALRADIAALKKDT